MGFFDSLGSFMGGVGGIASVAAPLIGAFKNKPKASPATAQLDQRSQQANQMATASADPNDPMYRNLVRLEEESGRVDLARAVNEMLRQRKHLGQKYGNSRYGAWFNPEREDERLSQDISGKGIEIGNRARATARNTLLQGSQAASGTLGATANLANIQGQQEAARQNQNKAIYGGIGDLGKSMAGSDWIKALTKQTGYNNIYDPPGGNNYYDWQYYG